MTHHQTETAHAVATAVVGGFGSLFAIVSAESLVTLAASILPALIGFATLAYKARIDQERSSLRRECERLRRERDQARKATANPHAPCPRCINILDHDN